MPSFDVVSEVDLQEVNNAMDQTNRELGTRFDFKGVDASLSRDGNQVKLSAEAAFQLDQIMDMFRTRLAKRGIDVRALESGPVHEANMRAEKTVTVREGIETDLAKKIVKLVKDRKLKVQSAIQGEKVRITGKKRDDLQAVMAVLKEGDFGLPLQFNNFRD